jgi:hypothetical protein
MHIVIEYPIGIILEAVVLSMEPNRLRVAAPGFPDVLELSRSGLEWFMENGQKIEIGFLQYTASEAAAIFPPKLALGARAAASYAS